MADTDVETVPTGRSCKKTRRLAKEELRPLRPARRGDAALGRAAGGDLCELPGEAGRARAADALVRLQRGSSPGSP